MLALLNHTVYKACVGTDQTLTLLMLAAAEHTGIVFSLKIIIKKINKMTIKGATS